MPQRIHNRNKPRPAEVVGMKYGDVPVLADLIEDERSIVLKVQGVDGHIMSVQHFLNIAGSQKFCVESDMRIGIDA